MTTTTTTSPKLRPNDAQKIMLDVLERARKLVDIAARAPLARDRNRAMRKLERAIEILSPDPKKI